MIVIMNVKWVLNPTIPQLTAFMFVFTLVFFTIKSFYQDHISITPMHVGIVISTAYVAAVIYYLGCQLEIKKVTA